MRFGSEYLPSGHLLFGSSRARVLCLFSVSLLFLPLTASPQNNPDSLLATLEESTGAARLEPLIALTALLCEEDAEQASMYGEEALSLLSRDGLSEQDGPSEQTLELLNSLAYAKNILSEFPVARELADRAAALAAAQGNKPALAQAYRNLGRSHRSTGDYGAALERYRQAGELFEEISDLRSQGDIWNDLGITHWMLADYPAALASFLRSREVYEHFNDRRRTAAVLNNIGMLYRKLERPTEALEHYHQALQIRQIEGPSGSLANVLNNIGNIHRDLEQYEEALQKYQQALELGPTETSGRVNTLDNLCSTQQSLGALAEAAACFRQILDIRREHNNQAGQVSTLINLATVTREQGDPETALELFEEAFELAVKVNARPELQAILREQAQTLARTGRYREAFETQTAYENLRGEIFAAENLRRIAELEERFEADKKTRKIENLEQQRLIADLQLKAENVTRRILLVTFAALFLVGLLLFNRYRLGQRAAANRNEADRQREMAQQLEEVARLKDEFLANSSHQLRAPLHGIIDLARSLAAGSTGPLKEETRRHLGLIATNGHRLRHLVENLLDLSELRHKSLHLHRTAVDLHSALEVEFSLLRPFAESKNLRLVNGVPHTLPAVYGDEQRLRQILHNLVSNGIKFTDTGAVTVSAEQQGEEILCRVADTGRGISGTERQHLFDELAPQTATSDLTGEHDPSEHDPSKHGLGLAVTRRLVELHGGILEVESNPNQGSAFSFNLPIAPGPAPPTPQPAESPPWTTQLPKDTVAENDDGVAKPLLLLIDDDPTNLTLLQFYLAPQGYRLLLASTGQEGLRLAWRYQPQLILLDIMMPTMSGYEVCSSLREVHSAESLPILFLTSKSQLADMVEGFRCGANDYLIKPIRQDELLARVEIHLKLLTSHQNLERMVEEKAAELKVLRGLLPICAVCKMIRDDEGFWNQMEVYIDSHTEASFSHGLCPTCAATEMAALKGVPGP